MNLEAKKKKIRWHYPRILYTSKRDKSVNPLGLKYLQDGIKKENVKKKVEISQRV